MAPATSNPIALVGVLLALTASLGALVLLAAVALLAIPIVGACFWGSVAYLLAKLVKDELFKRSPRRIPIGAPPAEPAPTIDLTADAEPFMPAEPERLTHAVEKFDWSLIHEPEPAVILACSAEEAKDEVVVKPRRKRKTPGKKCILAMLAG